MQLFKKDKDGDTELTLIGWLVVPFGVTCIVIGAMSKINSLKAGTTAVSRSSAAQPEATYRVQLDSNIADAIALACERNGKTLECIISNKMQVRASLSPLEFVCYKGDVQLRSASMYDDIDAGGKIKYTMYCTDNFDRAILRQRQRSY